MENPETHLEAASDSLRKLVEAVADKVEAEPAMHRDNPDLWVEEGRKHIQIGLMCLRRALQPSKSF